MKRIEKGLCPQKLYDKTELIDTGQPVRHGTFPIFNVFGIWLFDHKNWLFLLVISYNRMFNLLLNIPREKSVFVIGKVQCRTGCLF